jgi:tetratricopeptide (TPR) repeat protein
LLGEGNYTDAIEELGGVLLFDANDTRALRLLARAHAYEGNLEDAQNLYEALAQMLTGDAEAHLHLGYLYALQDESERAGEQFRAAFETDFDYLLHDFAPFFIALREALEQESGEYLPPRVIKYSVPPPRSMDSRRAATRDGFSVLIDHEGNVIAAQIGAQSGGSAPLTMLSLVKATYEPASLNGIPIPALVRMGDVGSQAQ